MRMRLGVFMLACLVPLVAEATSPTSLDELLDVSLQHYPKIAEIKAKRDASEAEVVQSLGAFDASLDNTTILRPSGFYDGNYNTTRLVKPLTDLNAKLSAGYRVSEGDFPIYDDYNFTKEGGEFNLEVFFSLLRDRDIDDSRLRLWNSALQQTKAEQELLLSKIAVQRSAMIAYFEWIAASQILDIQQELLDLARQRQNGLKQRQAHGDIAAITATENEQYLFRREGQLNDAKRLYRNAALNLSLYWRDAEGNPVVATEIANNRFGAHDPAALGLSVEREALTQQRPEFKIIEAEIKTQENELRAGENSLLPRADVLLRSARDIGGGSFTRDGTEHIVQLNISVPLQQRLGEGRAAKAKAKLRALEQEQRLLRDQLVQQLEYLENDLATAERNIEWSRKEVQVATKVQSAEAKLFASGGSDYFVLNQREEQRASAKIKNVNAVLDYFRALANAYAATMKLDKLKIS